MPAFRDGTRVNICKRQKDGRELKYLRISAGPQRGKYVHQIVAEAMLGRALLPNEEVDHQDQNTLNNDWTNLVVRVNTEHTRVGNARRRR